MSDTMRDSTKLDNLITKLETADAESFGWLRGNVVMYLSALHQILLAEESCEVNGVERVIEEIKRVKEFL